MPSDTAKGQSPFGWLLAQTKDFRASYMTSIALAVLGVVCQMLPYFFTARIIAALMAQNHEPRFYVAQCTFMLVAWFLRVLFHALSTAVSHRATFQVLAQIRKRCMEKLAKMPLGAVLSEPSGALKNVVVERVDSMETTLAHIVPEFTSNLLVPVALLIILFFVDWRMALASLATLPVGMLCFAIMMANSDKYWSRAIETTKTLNDTAVEYIGGIEVIKVFGKSQSSYERFVKAAQEAADSFISWMRRMIVPFTFGFTVMPATLVAVLPIGGLLFMRGSLDAETFIFCIIASLALITPLITAMSYNDDIATMKATLGEIIKIADAPEMARPASLTAKPNDATIKLTNIKFAYDEKEVLHGIDMEIPEGAFVALVGPSGSGKSTIARLIASLWDVTGGAISFGGVDIREIPLETYSDKIAYVSQENYLFNQTIRENIRMGKTNGYAKDAEVEAAAKESGCHEFIMSLENGYDTIAGSAGGHLSGGERQRICIARAMLKNAPVVILDEATAYTDPESEVLIQESVAKLVKGKTLVVIAHRLSTIKDADKIYVINKGAVEESGTHDALLQKGGLYKTMWDAHMSVKDE